MYKMITRVLTHLPKSLLLVFILSMSATWSLQGQDVSYTCQCNETLPDGVIEFKIRAFGTPGADWRVENAVNLYEDAALTIPILDSAMIPDVNNAGRYCLNGFSSDGVLPTVDVLDGSNPAVALQMLTCRTPEVEIQPIDMDPASICVGGVRRFCIEDLFGSLTSITWTAPGSSSVTQLNGDRCADIEYPAAGSYVISVSGETVTGCAFTDDLIVVVDDMSDDFSLEGESAIYTCTGVVDFNYTLAGSEGQATNFKLYQATAAGALGPLVSTTTGSGTGSGSGPTVTVSPIVFPAGDQDYILVACNANPAVTSCDFEVSQAISVRTSLDFVEVLGPSCTCTDVAQTFQIGNSTDFENVSWTANPATGVTISPMGGVSPAIDVTFTAGGTYTLTATGFADADHPQAGCPFTTDYVVEVTDLQQGSIACNSSVNVSLNNNCELEITPDMILEGEHLCNDAYNLVITDANGNLITGAITEDNLGETLTVSVEQICGANSCWGNLTVEDKSVTPLECPDGPISTLCFEIDDFSSFNDIVGLPLFDMDVNGIFNASNNSWLVSGHDNCSDVIMTLNDVNNSDDCAAIQNVLRTWTIVDQTNGGTHSCSVELSVATLMSDAIEFPKNWDSALDQSLDSNCGSLDACNESNPDELPCDMYTLDENGNPSPDCTGRPTGLLCSNLQVIGYTDTVLPGCGQARKILRNWTVFDECQQQETKHTQIITLENQSNPVCIAPVDQAFTSDVHECTGNLTIPPPIVVGGCLPVRYTVSYNYVNDVFDVSQFITDGVTNTSQDIDEPIIIENIDFAFDSIWVRYIVTDECGTPIPTTGCILEASLDDNEQPIPACDLNNIVALNEDGCAFAGPATFDDHSFDNCGIYQTVIQRMDQSNCSSACNSDNDCELRNFDFMIFLGEFGGHYYYLSRDDISGRFAASYSEALDGELASFDQSGEQAWLDTQVAFYTSDDYHATGSIVASPARYVVEFDDRCGWTQQEKFCCNDAGQETMMMLRVIDNFGNHNFCMVNVKVRDYIAPEFTSCPDDVTVSCDANVDFSMAGLNSRFGAPTATDFECSAPEITGSMSTDPRNECGIGSFTRTWTVEDDNGNAGVNTCSQRITFSNLDPFTENDITWPADAVLTSGCTLEGLDPLSLPPASQMPTFVQKTCSTVVANHTDLLFPIVEEACQKLVRTWSVVDWCNPSVIYTFDQVIKLENTTTPTVNCPSAPSFGPLLNCQKEVTGLEATLGTGDACTSSTVWTHTIDGSAVRQGNIADGTFGIGTHSVTFTLRDACGNEGTCTSSFSVTDDVSPVPYCHSELTVPLSTEAGVQIWANDIDLGSDDDCSSVSLSFTQTPGTTSMTLDCDDLGLTPVVLYVIDESGNVASCMANIFVQDNVNICGGTRPVAQIEGQIRTEDSKVIDDAAVSLMSSFMAGPMVDMSDEGEYAFEQVLMYYDYQLSPEKNDNYLNGVSTLDLIMIQRHILGIETLDSPYKLIAADVNNSQRIDGLDLVELRKLILGIYIELPQNDSWRFVNSSQTFIDPTIPWPFDENREVLNFSQDVTDADFIGVKIGDVNLSAVVNDLPESGLPSSNGDFELELVESITDKGNTRIQVIATEDAELLGNQMSFDFDSEDILAVVPMKFELEDNNIAMDAGFVKLSYDNLDGVTVSEGDILVEFLLKGDKVTMTSSTVLAPEVYTEKDGKIQSRAIKFTETTQSLVMTVDQNMPNPFKDNTVIGFNLAKGATVSLTLTDVNGKLISKQEQFYNAGYNQIELSSDQIGTTGVVYYQLNSGNQTVTRKMIVLK